MHQKNQAGYKEVEPPERKRQNRCRFLKLNKSCVGCFDYLVNHDDDNTSLLPATALRKARDDR